jgi:hypothetical protein
LGFVREVNGDSMGQHGTGDEHVRHGWDEYIPPQLRRDCIADFLVGSAIAGDV